MLHIEGMNYWALLVVWLLYMAVGAWWYSTAGFAKQWTKYTGVNILEIPTNQANTIILWVAVSSLVQAATLGVVLHSLGVNSLVDGLIAGLILWFGLTAATTVGVTLYSRRSWKFMLLNSSYFFVVMIIGSAVFALWK